MKYETYVEYRDKANTYDSKIAEQTGIPKSTFSGWKDGLFTPKFDKQEKIAKVLNINRGTARIFMEFGMHCLGCPHATAESLEDACAVHGANVDELVHQLNEWLAENE